MLQRRKSSVAQQQILQQQQHHQQNQQQHQSGTVSTPQVSASQCDSVPIFYQLKKKIHTHVCISLVEIIVPLLLYYSYLYILFFIKIIQIVYIQGHLKIARASHPVCLSFFLYNISMYYK